MSISASKWAWSVCISCGLPQTERLLLLALADYANDQGCAWPSVASLAKMAGVTDRRASANLRGLEARGLIVSERGGGRARTTIYVLQVGRQPNSETGTLATGNVVRLVRENPDAGGTKPGRWRHETLTLASPEPLRTIKNPSRAGESASRQPMRRDGGRLGVAGESRQAAADLAEELRVALGGEGPLWAHAPTIVAGWLKRGATAEALLHAAAEERRQRAERGARPPAGPLCLDPFNRPIAVAGAENG